MKKKKIVLSVGIIVVVLLIIGIVCALYFSGIIGGGRAGHYTYRIAMADTPENISPLSWESGEEREILSYTTSPLYDVTMDAEGQVDCRPCLAADLPEDVTTEYANDEVYGVPEDATEGYAYRISLRSDAQWEDGTAITTADFAYALQLYLQDDARAGIFYNSYADLANAKAYVDALDGNYVAANGDDYAEVADEDLYFSLTAVNALFKTSSFAEYYDYYAQDKPFLFLDEDYGNIYEELQVFAGGRDYVPLTEESKALLVSFCQNYGKTAEDAYRALCFCLDEDNAPTLDSVGFLVEDDTTMTLVLAKQVDVTELAYALSDWLLVKQDLYEADPEAYGTALSSYPSYGPYTITSYHANGMKLAANTDWFGYGDDAFEGQYQTTNIEMTFGSDTASDADSTALQMNGATEVLTACMDFSALLDKNTNKQNHVLVAYKDFRHAISLAIDRAAYRKAVGVDASDAYGLISTAYWIDLTNAQKYRDTEAAAKTLSSVYGEPDEEGSYGLYDLEKAANDMQAAYDAALMDGNMTESDMVVVDFYAQSEDAASFLQAALDEAAAGTDLEGRITVRAVDTAEEADLYERTVSGKEGDVCAYLQEYLQGDAIDNGFGAGIASVTIQLESNKITHSYRTWYNMLTQGSYASASAEEKTAIVAALEKGILATYKDIPLYVQMRTNAYSDRMEAGSLRYYPDGSVSLRDLSYSMDDKEWSQYSKNRENTEYAVSE